MPIYAPIGRAIDRAIDTLVQNGISGGFIWQDMILYFIGFIPNNPNLSGFF